MSKASENGRRFGRFVANLIKIIILCTVATYLVKGMIWLVQDFKRQEAAKEEITFDGTKSRVLAGTLVDDSVFEILTENGKYYTYTPVPIVDNDVAWLRRYGSGQHYVCFSYVGKCYLMR